MLTERSLKALQGVHGDLVRVVHRADELTDLEFIVTEGVRSMKRQRELVAAGASATLKSRHLTGHAIDFVPVVYGEISWKWPAFMPIVEAFEKASKELGIPIECGARWKKFPDGPHVQLPWKVYP
jgi:peptidoglycan L-alanyl-D-glutamate endopeptidase CwlK